MNVNAYLKRIGLDGPTAPTIPVLQAIAKAHPMAIPFENLNPFLALGVDTSVEALEEKLVQQRRGGYCYEQNLLLWEVLKSMGFYVHGLAARVMWMRPPDEVTARAHMLLLVKVNGETFIVDGGFGGATPTAALKLVANVEQQTPHEPYRLLNHDEEWQSQVFVQGEWKSLYRFDLQHQYPQDYKFANYYASCHPESHFTGNLIAARPTPDGRITLNDRQFGCRPIGGEAEKMMLESPAEIREVLETRFNIDTSQLPKLDERLNTLFAAEGV